MTCFKCEIPTLLLVYRDSRQEVLLWILSHHASYCTSIHKVPLFLRVYQQAIEENSIHWGWLSHHLLYPASLTGFL